MLVFVFFCLNILRIHFYRNADDPEGDDGDDQTPRAALPRLKTCRSVSCSSQEDPEEQKSNKFRGLGVGRGTPIFSARSKKRDKLIFSRNKMNYISALVRPWHDGCICQFF